MKRSLKLYQHLVSSSRPLTGFFAFALTIMGFLFYKEKPVFISLFTALMFTLITISIMVFNDLVDKHHDVQKNKNFAHEHSKELTSYFILLSTIIGCCLITIATVEMLIAWFCGIIWIIGLGYSFVPHWFIIQNMIVAFCSASPVLCGSLYHQKLYLPTFFSLCIIFCFIATREILKDVADRNIDDGYKKTVPTETRRSFNSNMKATYYFVLPPYFCNAILNTLNLIQKELLTTVIISFAILSWIYLCLPIFLNWWSILVCIPLAMLELSIFFFIINERVWVRPAQLLMDKTIALFILTAIATHIG